MAALQYKPQSQWKMGKKIYKPRLTWKGLWQIDVAYLLCITLGVAVERDRARRYRSVPFQLPCSALRKIINVKLYFVRVRSLRI